nr:hypothetical protein [Tanacetum cinerariifolium]
PRTPEGSEDESNDEEDQELKLSKEARIQEEEEADELYLDVNINQGRGLQVTQNVKDSHVTLTSVQPDGPQESSSVSSFVTSMLNPTSDVGVESIFTTASSPIVSLQTPTPIMTPSIIATITTSRDVKNQVKEQVSCILPRIKESMNATLEAEVLTRSSHSSRTSYAIAADLSEMELKKILIEKMEGNKSIQQSDEQRNLYKVLVEEYDADKAILDTYGESTILKRRREDDDQEGPSTGSDQRSKRQKEGGEHASASTLSEIATGGTGRSTTGSQSRQLYASESAFAEEPVQTTCQIEEPLHLVFETGADDQPIVQTSQHPEWFSQPRRPPSPNRDWNKTLPAAQGDAQSWISGLARQTDARSSFNELLDTSVDFSNFIMNRLNVDTLTPELLAGPTYELMRGSCNSLTKLEYHLEEFYGYAVNREALDVYSKRRILAVTELKIVEWHDYKHLDWILVRRDDDQIYKFKEGDFKRRVEDLQLGVESYQKRLNLTKPDTYRTDLRRREAYTAYSNPRGFIYQNKDKKNRLMQIDDLYKFSDGTLNDVHNALDDRLKGIRMQYLSTTIWRRGDKDRAAAMIQAIKKMLKTRRIMRSLEKFVGGRLYEGDFRMLQRTI